MTEAANGGPAAPVAAVMTGTYAVLEGRSMSETLRQSRFFQPSRPDSVLIERGAAASVAGALQGRGHRLQEAQQLGSTTAIICYGGLTLDRLGCEFASDKRGHGLAAGGANRLPCSRYRAGRALHRSTRWR